MIDFLLLKPRKKTSQRVGLH